jgi:4-hydroxy-3-polyprenylbenzoate decarboxylase
MTGAAISNEIPGLKEVHAVDAAGVHPLLLAIGSERYTPYLQNKRPAEILTIANHILGTGQLSLAKFLWITAPDANSNIELDTHKEADFFAYVLERMDFTKDLHFYTNTTIDTLDYSGENLNSGSKLVLAAYGEVKRTLTTHIPDAILNLNADAHLIMPGVISLNSNKINTSMIQTMLSGLGAELLNTLGVALLVLTEDAAWMAADMNNFLWAAFTRANPSHDIDGVDAFVSNKHWGCKGPLIIDATIKKHHAPPVVKDAEIEKRVDAILAKYGY